MAFHSEAFNPIQFREKLLTHQFQQPSFQAPRFWSNPHVQTVSGAFLRKKNSLKLDRKRVRLDLPDKDFFDIDYCPSSGQQGVIIFHGVGGSSRSAYVMELQNQLNQHQMPNVAVNLRGASGFPNHSIRAYHAGAGEEIEVIVNALLPFLHQACANVQVWHLVGFSLSGSMLIHWWSEQQLEKPSPIGLVLTICAPLRLVQCAHALNSGLGRCYQRYLLTALKDQFQKRLEYFRGLTLAQGDHNPLEPFASCLQARSFWEFDDRYVAPAHGFAGARDYYEQASAEKKLDAGTWPLLMVQALDDPLVPYICPSQLSLSASVRFWSYPQGGHVGFMGFKALKIHSFLAEIITHPLLSCQSTSESSIFQ